MNKQEYKEYLKSRKWLLKKHEFISAHLKMGWEIKCAFCDIIDGLEVHHWDYKTLGKEEVADLVFTCRNCHQRVHFERGFVDNWISKVFLNPSTN